MASLALSPVAEIVPILVPEISPVLVAEMVPVLVAEMVPVLVAEMVPLLVPEMRPPFAKAGADIARTNMPENTIGFTFFIVCSLKA